MGPEETVFELLHALAAVRKVLVDKEVALWKQTDERRTSHNLTIWETDARAVPVPDPPGVYLGVHIAASLVLHQLDGTEVEWHSIANNRRDGSGWVIERVVDLNESPIGEPVALGQTELPVVVVQDSIEMARALPALVDELLALPVPAPAPGS